jgi:recombinational DNA repair protein RecT
MAQEVDVPLLETHARQLATALLGHIVIIFANGVQVLRNYSGFVQLARRAHLAQLTLVIKIFFGVVEPATAFH